jgi:AcrR family transcriptional regulator
MSHVHLPTPDVVGVNMESLRRDVDDVNTARYDGRMTVPAKGRYHHGDLRRALLEEAVRTIGREGPQGLTLRAVGARLGVSRTALYRHFLDKSGLLAAVAEEGFGRLAAALSSAWRDAADRTTGFEEMGRAYVRFALDNPSHYRVMFGVWSSRERDHQALHEAGARAFQLLVDALDALQRDGIARADQPADFVARYVWAAVHGLAMLGIDGRLPDGPGGIRDVTDFAVRRLGSGLFAAEPSRPRAASAR